MTKDFLWVDKYAPRTIDDCILPTKLKEEFSSIETLPNMLFAGPAGVGKTTVARVLCNTLNTDMMFMNASIENGIDDVRNKIQSFASTTALFGDYKVLLLDEADNLSPDAQKSLRALIEAHQSNCRFILTCNYPYRLIDPLRSRLQQYNFTYPPFSNGKTLRNTFVKRLLEILQQEKISLSKEDVPTLVSLAELGYPNWRNCIHQLQRITAKGSIDAAILSQVKEQDITTLFAVMKAKNFTKMREWIAENMAGGMTDTHFCQMMYDKAADYMKPQALPQCVLTLGEYQAKAAVVMNQEINAVAMCTELMMGCEWL